MAGPGPAATALLELTGWSWPISDPSRPARRMPIGDGVDVTFRPIDLGARTGPG
jgi:hypothetical protein